MGDTNTCNHSQTLDLVNMWLPPASQNHHLQQTVYPQQYQPFSQSQPFSTPALGISCDPTRATSANLTGPAPYEVAQQVPQFRPGFSGNYRGLQYTNNEQQTEASLSGQINAHTSGATRFEQIVGKLGESPASEASTKTATSTTSSVLGSNSNTPQEEHSGQLVESGSKREGKKCSQGSRIATISSKEGKKSESDKTTCAASYDEERLKTYLNQFVLASNVPFAYAIILFAFLITMIAATSIITILTIVLTLTGYTAYPITENTFNTSLFIGVLCASFALAIVTGSLIVWRRYCNAAYYYLDEPQDASRGTNSPQPSETYDSSEYRSIMVNDWSKHVQKLHADGDIGFSQEFEQIQQANQKNTALTCDHSQLPENKHKNRYINIVAYDHTRVILRPPLGGQKKLGYDYINANFIDVSMNET